MLYHFFIRRNGTKLSVIEPISQNLETIFLSSQNSVNSIKDYWINKRLHKHGQTQKCDIRGVDALFSFFFKGRLSLLLSLCYNELCILSFSLFFLFPVFQEDFLIRFSNILVFFSVLDLQVNSRTLTVLIKIFCF